MDQVHATFGAKACPLTRTHVRTFLQAVLQRVEGILSVTAGYAGGQEANPTYAQVKAKETGHIEVCQVAFEHQKVELKDILEVRTYSSRLAAHSACRGLRSACV